jgi:hypothetical protein
MANAGLLPDLTQRLQSRFRTAPRARLDEGEFFYWPSEVLKQLNMTQTEAASVSGIDPEDSNED